jgi:hypothetical protein
MSELSVVSPYYPIIPIFGNHERFPVENEMIFKASFENYKLTEDARVDSY